MPLLQTPPTYQPNKNARNTRRQPSNACSPPRVSGTLGFVRLDPRRPGIEPADQQVDERHEHAKLAARYGQEGTAPFLTTGGAHVIPLAGGKAACGYLQHRRWAVTAGDVVAPHALADLARSEYLDHLRDQRLHPIFVAIADPRPFARRAFAIRPVADEAIVTLRDFQLAGSRRANLRHSVQSARRGGIRIRAATVADLGALAAISAQWLSSKRGGELGFTLSRQQEVAQQLNDGLTDAWLATDGSDQPIAWCTWRHYQDGHARVLDVMRRLPDAPNPSMDLLIVTCLERYRDAGVELASLSAVPRSQGRLAERIYPTGGLRRYKDKFAPEWQPRFLAVENSRQLVPALLAVAHVYCPAGVRHAISRNR